MKNAIPIVLCSALVACASPAPEATDPASPPAPEESVVEVSAKPEIRYYVINDN